MTTVANTTSSLPTITLEGVRLHVVTEEQAVAHILDSLNADRGGVVVTPNLDHLRRCRVDADFARFVDRADLSLADGMPLVWASRLQKTPLPQRVAGSNLIDSLSASAARAQRSVFLLGGAPGTAESAGKILCDRHPGLNIAGTFCPPVGFESDSSTIADIGKALSVANPAIVFVALGSPKQERLIDELRPLLPRAWWLGVGISFSFLTGDVKRAPIWMQRAGLEWTHRLLQEPRRLFTRYVIQGLPFAVGLFARSMSVRLSSAENVSPMILNTTIQMPRRAGSPAKQELDPGLPWSKTLTDPALARLKEIILLGGSVRASALARSAQRAVVDLPIDEHRTILDQWAWQAEETARLMRRDALPARLLLSSDSPLPSGRSHSAQAIVTQRDANAFRGTGGALRDAASDGDDHDLLLIASAAQVLLDPLPLLVAAMGRLGGDAALIAHADGTPSGVMLLPRAALKLIPTFGFVDLKEQALPIIARQFDVRVLRRARPTGLPIRSTAGYCAGLRHYHRRRDGLPITPDPAGEHWTSAFSLVEPGAIVWSGAELHDSVVLEGARIEPGATLVRCVVCPGGVVRRGETVVDELIGSSADAMRGRKAA